MRVVLVLLVAMLAGCVDKPPSSAADDLGVEAFDRPIDVAFYAGGEPFCAVGCFGGGAASAAFDASDHERILGFAFAVTADESTFGGPHATGPHHYTVQVTCASCAAPLAEAAGPVPLALEHDGPIAWGEGIEVEVALEATTGPDFLAGAIVRLQGALRIEEDPALEVHEEVVARFAFEAVTGLCAFVVEPDCTSVPGHRSLLGPFDRPLGVSGNVTWDAIAPTTQELEVEVRCMLGASPIADRCPGQQARTWTGTSPLAFDEDLADYPEGVFVEMVVYLPEPYSYASRQEFHAEGVVVALPSDDDARDPS